MVLSKFCLPAVTGAARRSPAPYIRSRTERLHMPTTRSLVHRPASCSRAVLEFASAHTVEDVTAVVRRHARELTGADGVTFVESLAMVPIRSEDPIGSIGAYWDHQHEATDAELELLQVLADFASVALRNVELMKAVEAEEARYRGIVEDQTERRRRSPAVRRGARGGVRRWLSQGLTATSSGTRCSSSARRSSDLEDFEAFIRAITGRYFRRDAED